MKKIHCFLLIIYILKIFLCSKIQRKHKHPGSSQSDNTNIEIEPLNDENNLDDKSEINPESNMNGNKMNDKNNPPPSYYNEDDEFVYGKKEEVLNLDQELEKGKKINQNSGNIPNTQDK